MNGSLSSDECESDEVDDLDDEDEDEDIAHTTAETTPRVHRFRAGLRLTKSMTIRIHVRNREVGTTSKIYYDDCVSNLK